MTIRRLFLLPSSGALQVSSDWLLGIPSDDILTPDLRHRFNSLPEYIQRGAIAHLIYLFSEVIEK